MVNFTYAHTVCVYATCHTMAHISRVCIHVIKRNLLVFQMKHSIRCAALYSVHHYDNKWSMRFEFFIRVLPWSTFHFTYFAYSYRVTAFFCVSTLFIRVQRGFSLDYVCVCVFLLLLFSSWKIEAANNWNTCLNIFMFACTFTHFSVVYLLEFVLSFDRITLKIPIQLFVHYNYSEQIPPSPSMVETLFCHYCYSGTHTCIHTEFKLIFNTRHWNRRSFPNSYTICSRDEIIWDEMRSCWWWWTEVTSHKLKWRFFRCRYAYVQILNMT